MAIEAVRYVDDGTLTAPSDDAAWAQWVSARTTRNFVLDDPLLEWLKLHGERKGFVPDDKISGYDPGTDFTRFILSQGRKLETAVMAYLRSLQPFRTIATGRRDSHRSR